MALVRAAHYSSHLTVLGQEMSLAFGIFDTFSHAEGELQRSADLYDEHLEDARLADRLGYSHFFFIEHQNAGFPCVSAPAVYLTALAQATRRIRFGAMVFQMPLHHPVRLAQDTALIDQLSRGRFDFAIGYGTRLGEFQPWDIDFMARRGMGVEAMEVVLKAWTEERMTHEGKFWRFKDAQPQPRPYQRPHPPVWVGGHSETSFDYAAEHNFHVAQNLDVERLITEKFTYFRAAWRRHNHSGPMPKLMLVRHVHVAETDAQARAEAEPYMLEGLIGLDGVKRAKSLRVEEATPQMLETARVYLKTAESYDFWIEEGLGFVGSPETVAREIAAQQARVGHDILLTQHNIGNMPHAMAQRSIRLFGERVLPAFAADAQRALA
jgi:alkanesulfonate monooxygenase SsuD/methylene tetrahydromethanopterin reductase-like flavin-dependent oxidoreductase (luciferase family)